MCFWNVTVACTQNTNATIVTNWTGPSDSEDEFPFHWIVDRTIFCIVLYQQNWGLDQQHHLHIISLVLSGWWVLSNLTLFCLFSLLSHRTVPDGTTYRWWSVFGRQGWTGRTVTTTRWKPPPPRSPSEPPATTTTTSYSVNEHIYVFFTLFRSSVSPPAFHHGRRT